MASKVAAAKVMMPMPPASISSSNTHWPNRVNWLPTSTTDRPVTVTAEVAVNMACNQLIGEWVAMGNLSSNAPNTIKKKKLPASATGGDTSGLWI